MNEKEIMSAVSRVLAARAELLRLGTHPADALIMTGMALGTLLAGGKP